jgi:hypothetical protein
MIGKIIFTALIENLYRLYQIQELVLDEQKFQTVGASISFFVWKTISLDILTHPQQFILI